MDDKRVDLSLWRDLQEGAALEGEPAPNPEEVAAMAALLREAASPTVPSDLVPHLVQALPAAGAVREPKPQVYGIRPLLRLVWAEARFMPLLFLVTEAALLAGACLIDWMLDVHLLRGAAGGRSLDGLTLMAPWLGVVASLFMVRTTGRSVWGELEALSPFSPGVRLLARSAAATLALFVGIVATWMIRPGPEPFSLAVLLLARTAPLLMAEAWAVVWAVRFGPKAAVGASLGLWGMMTVLGPQMGPWNLLAVPQRLSHAAPQWTALALAAVLWLWVAWQGRMPAGAGAHTTVQGR